MNTVATKIITGATIVAALALGVSVSAAPAQADATRTQRPVPHLPGNARRQDGSRPVQERSLAPMLLAGLSPGRAHAKRYRPPKHDPRPDNDNDRGAAGNSGSSDYLLYRGGPVQTSPRTYLVFWGNWSQATDSYNVQGQLYWFLNAIGGSAFNNKMTAYAQGCYVNTYSCPNTATYIQNPAHQLRNYWYDNTSYVPARPTQTDVANEAVRAAQHFGDYDVNTQFVIALPRGHDDASFPSTCGYHAWRLYGSSAIQYTSLSYTPDAGTYGCWNNTFGSILDGVTIVEGHEYAETETDPWVGAGNGYEGWDDSTRNYGEIGDKCAGSGTQYNLRMTFYAGGYTFTFPVQTVWSNYNRFYYGNGCV
jgi:hypothetical protein